MRAWGVPGLGWVRLLRLGFARPLVAAVVGGLVWVLVCRCLVLSCLVVVAGLVVVSLLSVRSSCLVVVVVVFWFGLFRLWRSVLGVGLARALSAWGGGGAGFALVRFVSVVVVRVLLCRPVRCAVAAVSSAPWAGGFLSFFSFFACLPPPRPRLPPFLLSFRPPFRFGSSGCDV